MLPLKQSTALTVPFFAFDSNGDGVTGVADGSWTKRISKNGAAFGAMTVTVSEMENGWYSIPLSTSHTDTLGALAVSLSATGVKRVNMLFRVSARIADDLATAAALDTVDNFVDTEIGTLQTDVTTLLSRLTSGRATALDNLDATISSRLATTNLVTRTGTAQAGASNSIQLDASASGTNDTYNGQLILLTGGTGAGQSRYIWDYSGATKTVTPESNWITAPDNTTTFAIIASDLNRLTTIESSLSSISSNTSNTYATALDVLGRLGAFQYVATAQAGGGSTITLDTGASATNDLYVGQAVYLVSGTGAGQARLITDYVGATKVATVNRAWITNPDVTTQFALVGIDLNDIGGGGGGASAADVWDYAAASATTAGSLGKRVADFLTGDAYVRLGAPTGASISADLVDIEGKVDDLESRLGTPTGATIAADLVDIENKVDDLEGRLTAGRAANLDNLDTTVSSRGTGTALNASQVAAAVLDAVASSYNDAGSIGEKINAAGGAADPLLNSVPGAYGAGTAGYALGHLTGGEGSSLHTYTVTRSDTGAPLSGVDVWVTTDLLGTNVVKGPKATNASGQVKFLLNTGTWYFWRDKQGYTFTDPDIEVIA